MNQRKRGRKKERTVPLNSKASAPLKNYLGVRKIAENSILFLNRFAKGSTSGEKDAKKDRQESALHRNIPDVRDSPLPGSTRAAP